MILKNDCIENYGGRGGGHGGGGGHGWSGGGGHGWRRGGWGYNRWYPYVYNYPVNYYPVYSYPSYSSYPETDYVVNTVIPNSNKTLWDVLQYALQNYPTIPTQEDKNRMIIFINNLPNIICQNQECKVFITNYLANYKVKDVVNSKESVNNFFIELYNNLKTRYANI
jgi:hypothetical protein